MKTVRNVLALIVIFALQACVNDSDIKIPHGIRYKKASPEVNGKAQALIQDCFKSQPYRLEALFGSHILCGPKPWADLKTHVALKGMEITSLHIQMPVSEGRMQLLQGALFKTPEEVAAFCCAMQDYLKSSDTYTVRRPTGKELEIYWALIFYDITEPIFVAENEDHVILLDFGDELKVLWICDLAGMRFEVVTGDHL
jgi:hypothetical protein